MHGTGIGDPKQHPCVNFYLTIRAYVGGSQSLCHVTQVLLKLRFRGMERLGLGVELYYQRGSGQSWSYITSEGWARGGATLPARVGLEVELHCQRGWG